MHGVYIRDQSVFANKNLGIVTPESEAGTSEKMVSVATASFLHGMLKVGNLDLKCFLMGNLVAVTFSMVFLMVSALTQPK